MVKTVPGDDPGETGGNVIVKKGFPRRKSRGRSRRGSRVPGNIDGVMNINGSNLPSSGVGGGES